MTPLIYAFDTDATPSLSEVGGKSLSLTLTTRAGLPVTRICGPPERSASGGLYAR